MGDDSKLALRWWDGAAGVVCLIFVAIFTALVITRFQDALSRARAGRTRLFMDADLLIIGWSAQIPAYLRELRQGPAALMSRRYRVAVLADSVGEQLLEGMNDLLARERALKDIDIEVRSGTVYEPASLARVRASETPRVVVTSDAAIRNDSYVMLVLFGLQRAGFDWDRQSCVTEIFSADGARMAAQITGGHVTTVNPEQILSLLVTQAVRAQGMSQVVDQLISYKGCELYFADVSPDAAGMAFGEAVCRADNVSPIGIIGANGVQVRPAMSHRLERGERLIVVAKKGCTPSFGRELTQDWRAPTVAAVSTRDYAHVLLLGWSRIAAMSVRHLHGFLDERSHVDVLVCEALSSPVELDAARRGSRDHTSVTVATTVPEYHAAIGDRIRCGGYDVVAVLPYRDLFSVEESDAYTMTAMAVARQAIADVPTAPRILGELRSSAHQELAELAQPDDLIVSEALAASLALQLLDRPEVQPVLADLLDYRGSAFYIRDLSVLGLAAGSNYGDVVDATVASNEIPIGLRVGGVVELDVSRTYAISDEVSGVVVVARGTEDVGVEADFGSITARLTDDHREQQPT
jgi:hypothetical protein